MSGSLSWTDAEAACVANGGNLASMHSDADHLVVMRACNEVSDTGNCWIGLNDADEEGTFVWTDGSALDVSTDVSTDTDADLSLIHI